MTIKWKKEIVAEVAQYIAQTNFELYLKICKEENERPYRTDATEFATDSDSIDTALGELFEDIVKKVQSTQKRVVADYWRLHIR